MGPANWAGVLRRDPTCISVVQCRILGPGVLQEWLHATYPASAVLRVFKSTPLWKLRTSLLPQTQGSESGPTHRASTAKQIPRPWQFSGLQVHQYRCPCCNHLRKQHHWNDPGYEGSLHLLFQALLIKSCCSVKNASGQCGLALPPGRSASALPSLLIPVPFLSLAQASVQPQGKTD